MPELPKQIASGIVRIGEVDVEVVQLDNGARLITQESIQKLIGADLLAAFVDVQQTHALSTEPQSIADQIMLKCACGWSEPVPLHMIETREQLLAEISRRHLEHVAEDQALKRNA